MVQMRESKPSWQQHLADGFASAQELLAYLQLPSTLASPLAEKQFRTRVPRGFAARMTPGNPHDPLLLQVLATPDELQGTMHFSKDPLAEAMVTPHKGLLHKYQGRVLFIMTGSCAIHCRYCFRRHFPYQEHNPGRAGWASSLAYIAQHKDIHEVILSGGDPLLVKDNWLAELLTDLAAIPHLRTVRFHTRIPVVLPERITPSLLRILEACPLRKVIVLHSNHPQELDDNVLRACEALAKASCHLLNQSVLLARVNDDVDVLAHLSERLFTCGVLPYYLHVLDKVEGAGHFDLPLPRALQIFRDLQARLPGYLVPRLAREDAGKTQKTLLV
jgi:EF-P beta-lysylation protein EpmB